MCYGLIIKTYFDPQNIVRKLFSSFMLFRSVAIGFVISALGGIQVFFSPEIIFLSVANILEAMRAPLFNLKNPNLDILNSRW